MHETKLHPCARCARMQRTCCQKTEVVLTVGDRARLARHVGHDHFWQRQAPADPDDADFDPDDPNWQGWTVAADGSRAILKHVVAGAGEGDCVFLGAAGCVLAEEVRPLICRLYPYDYDESGRLTVAANHCPTTILLADAPAGTTMADLLDMPREKAEGLRARLYEELRNQTESEAPLRIGLVYDLRDDYLALGWSVDDVAEFDSASTIDGLEAALIECGHTVERIGNADRLIARLAAGDRWDLCFSVAECVAGKGRESLVPALLDHYGIASTFADPLVCGLTLDKPLAKRVLRDLGLPTPAFFVVETQDDVAAVTLPAPLFAKPSREGSSKGIEEQSLIRDKADLAAVCADLLKRFDQPVLVEAFLPGREVTVSIVGSGDDAEVVGVLEVLARSGRKDGVYSYEAKENWRELLDYRLVDGDDFDTASTLALAAYRGIGCRDAGRVDLRMDPAGLWSIIEINALPGMNHVHSDLPMTARMAGWNYADLIDRIVRSAAQRMGATRTAARR